METESFNIAEFLLETLYITPWTLFGLVLIVLVVLVYYARTYPTLVLAAAIPVLALAAIPLQLFGAGSGTIALFAVPAFVIAVFALVDLLTLPTKHALSAHRKMAKVASIASSHPTEVTVENRSWAKLLFRIAEDSPEDTSVDPPNHTVKIPSKKSAAVKQNLVATRRGQFQMEYVFVTCYSACYLWKREISVECKTPLHVYPDIKQIGDYALLARTNRLSQIGVRRTRRAGQDNDFERLREYQQDDNYRHIDWRATARRQKVTVRQFQTDQSQRVIFLLDCGRMMTNTHKNLSMLDHALNATLMLSYVALDQGDSVGMLAFSDRIHTYVPPASGKRQMNRLLHAGFNQFPELVQSRFDEAFLYLSEHCRRRSLVVLVSNVVDQVNAAQIENYLQNLVGAHLPLLVLLRDHSIFDAADHPAPDPDVLYRSAAASQLLLWRDQVLKNVQARGALTLDLFPEKMTASLVNEYLEIKARHLL